MLNIETGKIQMKKKYSGLKIIGKVYKQTLGIVPFSGIVGILNYLAQGLFPAVTTVILSKLFNSVYDKRFGDMRIYGLLFVLSYAVVYILQFVSSITINAGIYEKCTSMYRISISEKTARMGLIQFEDSEVLNIQKRAKNCVDQEYLSQIYMSLTVFITCGISVVATIAVLGTYHIGFVLFSLFSVIPFFFARVVRGKEFYLLKQKQASQNRKLNYYWNLFNQKQSAKEMRVMDSGKYLFKKWITQRDEVNEEIWQYNIKDATSLLLCDILKIVGYMISVALALVLVTRHKISIGVFGACIVAFKSTQEATKNFLIELGYMPQKFSFARDYYEFMDLEEENNGREDVAGFNDSIEIKGVDFKYPHCDDYALKNVNLTVKKGEKVVILGINGSGKTTLSKMILGLYTPCAGEVLIDGCPISDINKEQLYRYFSVIPQNFTKFLLSLRENVTISDLTKASDDLAVADAVKQVGGEDILTVNGGLDCQLGREFNGVEFSGGQWQKLALARGIFKDGRIMVLDEPTSSLDPNMETEILKLFLEMCENKTAVIISHRVGLCKFADKIVVMKDGMICEVGNHETLMADNGEYRKLYEAQECWYK